MKNGGEWHAHYKTKLRERCIIKIQWSRLLGKTQTKLLEHHLKN